MPEPEASPALPCLRWIMDLQIALEPPQEFGTLAGVERRVIPIAGGSFSGPDLAGEILMGGADWQVIRSDRVAVLDARYTLRTAAGDLILVENTGFRYGAGNLAELFATGQHVPPSEYYFTTTPRFQTTAPALQWLTRNIFVAMGERNKGAVLLRVFLVDTPLGPARTIDSR